MKIRTGGNMRLMPYTITDGEYDPEIELSADEVAEFKRIEAEYYAWQDRITELRNEAWRKRDEEEAAKPRCLFHYWIMGMEEERVLEMKEEEVPDFTEMVKSGSPFAEAWTEPLKVGEQNR